MADASLEPSIQAIGRTLYQRARAHPPGFHAGRRAVLKRAIADARLADALASWPLAPPRRSPVSLRPAHQPVGLEKARRYFDIGCAEGTLVYQGGVPDGDGYYFAPAIFSGIQPFGGTALSGTGVQAGSDDYLKQFAW